MSQKKLTATLDLNYFERVIGFNLLFNTDYLSQVIEVLKPIYFKNKDLRTVVSLINAFYETYQKIPALTELKSHLSTVEEKEAFKNVLISYKGDNLTYDPDILIQNSETFFREKAVYSTLVTANIDIQSGNIDTGKILNDFEKACSITLNNDLGLDYFNDIDKFCEDLENVETFLPTGWKWLDKHIGGGLLATGKSIYVFYGVTNVGKSIFLGNIAANILQQNKTVMIISLEMSEHVYAKRISSLIGDIPLSNLKQHSEELKSKVYKFKDTYKDARLIIKDFPPSTITPLQLKNYINSVIKKGVKPDVIVLDYINLLEHTQPNLNTYEKVKKITEQIRALSYILKCPIVSATQSNRTAYQQINPGIETTSESMGLSHTADVQMPIWTQEEDVDLGIIHYGIGKNRFGPRDCHSILQLDKYTLKLTDPDINTEKVITTINKNNMPSTLDTNIINTLNTIESVSSS